MTYPTGVCVLCGEDRAKNLDPVTVLLRLEKDSGPGEGVKHTLGTFCSSCMKKYARHPYFDVWWTSRITP
jgi:hypothetical protein